MHPTNDLNPLSVVSRNIRSSTGLMDRALAGELSAPIVRALALEDTANVHHFIESDRPVGRALLEVKPHR